MHPYLFLISALLTAANLRIAFVAAKRFKDAEQLAGLVEALLESQLHRSIELWLTKYATAAGGDSWSLCHHLTSARALLERMGSRAKAS
jgi:hypothetical protein